MSSFKKKTKTVTNQNTTATQTPTNLPGADTAVSGLLGKINSTFDGLDPYSLVAGPNDLQLQAARAAGALGGPAPSANTSAPWTDGVGGSGAPLDATGGNFRYPDGSGGSGMGLDVNPGLASIGAPTYNPTSPPKGGPIMGMTPGGAPQPSAGGGSGFLDTIRGAGAAGPQNVQGASLLDGLPSYMSPYTNDVVKTTLAGFDQNANQVRQQQQLDLGGDTTFGGSGGSILRSLTEGQFGQGRAATEAGLRDQAFNTGASLSGQDADRRQGASLANAGLAEQAMMRRLQAGTAEGDQTRANITQQSQIGEMLRQIEAAKKLAPITALGAQGSLISGLPLDLFHGGTSTGSLSGTTTGTQSGLGLGELLSYFAANAQAAAAGAGGG